MSVNLRVVTKFGYWMKKSLYIQKGLISADKTYSDIWNFDNWYFKKQYFSYG